MNSVKNIINAICKHKNMSIGIGLLGASYIGIVSYMNYLLKHSNVIRGIDKIMLDSKEYSAMISVIEIKNMTSAQIYELLKERLMVSINSREVLITRYIEDNKIKYHKDINYDTDYERKTEIINSILEVDDTIDDLSNVYRNPKFTKNKLPLKIYYHSTKNIICFVSNHAYADGWTVMNFLRHNGLFSSSYNLKLPKPFYCPIMTEYYMARTLIDMYQMEKRALEFPKEYTVSSVINITFDANMFKKTVLIEKTINDDININEDLDNSSMIEEKQISFIAAYVHYMMTKIFESCDFKHFNIAISAAVYNPNKINNLAALIMTIYRTDSLLDIENKINNRKYMVMSSYLATSFMLSSSSKPANIDILFSSIPGSKNNDNLNPLIFYLPYITYPIYISNLKVSDKTITCVHFKSKQLSDQNLFDKFIVDDKNIIKSELVKI